MRHTLGWALLYLLLAALLVSLSQGELPWRTELIMHPRGGVLVHIDPVGALLSLPIALAGGASPQSVALGFNLVAVLRFALAGFVALALWGCARALRRKRLRDHALAGLLTGLAAANSFYFGLALVLPLALLGGAASTAALALPVFLLILHNAVDPQELVRHGFASYDFAAAGELFQHSLYLRASLLLLALIGLRYLPRPRAAWLTLSLLPLVLALGPYLVWNGALVRIGAQVVGLAVPELAITHAARLGVVGIASLCGLAGVALSRLSPRAGWPPSLFLGGLVAALTSEDPHIQRSGDNDVLLSLERHTREERDSHTLSEDRLRQILPTRYAWVAVHEDLEAQGRGFDGHKGGLYTRQMTELLGEPTRSDGVRHAWELTQ